jgi:hypothetical protein
MRIGDFEFQCPACEQVLPLAAAARTYTQAGARSYSLCRLCSNARSKAYLRKERLKAFPKKLKKWSEEKLVSDIEYLGQRMELMRAELERRRGASK